MSSGRRTAVPRWSFATVLLALSAAFAFASSTWAAGSAKSMIAARSTEVGRSSVKLKYLGRHQKPLLMIRLWVAGPPSGKIQFVNLNLPRALSFRPRFASNAGAVPDFGDSRFTVWRGAASVEGLRNRYVKLEFGYGLLRVIRHRQLSHRPIHMEIGFASCPCGYESETETTQRLVLRLPRMRKR